MTGAAPTRKTELTQAWVGSQTYQERAEPNAFG